MHELKNKIKIMSKFKKYKKELQQEDNRLYSWNHGWTYVATIVDNQLVVREYIFCDDKGEEHTSSENTDKHLKYVAEQLDLTIVDKKA